MRKERICVEFYRYEPVEVTAADAELLAAANSATDLAYAPYSRFRVGAAGLLAGGRIVRAANLENAAYPQCLCAEANLLGTLHSQYPGEVLLTMAIAVSSEVERSEVAAPC